MILRIDYSDHEEFVNSDYVIFHGTGDIDFYDGSHRKLALENYVLAVLFDGGKIIRRSQGGLYEA